MRRPVKPGAAPAPASGSAAGLIWARPERPEHDRPALSRERIAQAALSIADAEGIDAISIRRLAAQFGVTAMALYWYIERKEDVFDLMIDAAYAELSRYACTASDWRSQLNELAVHTRSMMHRHPWLAAIVGHRPALGPNQLRKNEQLLTIVSQLGLDVRTNMQILAAVNAYIVGFMAGEAGEVEAVRRTGLTERDWQRQVAPYVQTEVVASGRYPFLAQAISERDEPHTDETFVFGLERLLEGVAAYADSRQPESADPDVARHAGRGARKRDEAAATAGSEHEQTVTGSAP